MRALRLALAQINPLVGDIEGNLRLIRSVLSQARQIQADLVVFPELAITGSPAQDLLLKPRFIDENKRALAEAAKSCVGLVAVVGYVEQGPLMKRSAGSPLGAAPDRYELYNAAAILADGRHVCSSRKRVLRHDGVHDEGRYFLPGQAGPLIDLHGATVGVTIGEDIWSWEKSGSVQAEVIVNIGASPFCIGRRRLHEQALAARARENGAFVVFVNLVGGQDELVFDGNSVIVDRNGIVVARARAFEEDLLTVDLDTEENAPSRSARGDENKPPKENDRAVERVSVEVPDFAGVRSPIVSRVEPELGDLDEVYRALVLGVKDYAGKNRFTNVVIGLSGGIDSALTAAIAVDAVGPGHVVGICMPSPYTSRESIEDVADLSHRLGVECMTIPITPLFEAYRRSLAQVFRETRTDQTEENLQARIRGTILMAFSNKFGHLVLTTGNKSEMGVGYATLYGDMAGGFAVIKDVPKTMVYELARLRNRMADVPVIPQRVLDRPPSAELKPNQKDEDSLPPYSMLDPILRAYVEEDRSIEDIVALGFDRETVMRVAGLVDRSEYKRRQAPIGVKITPRGFGREWRMPITNGHRHSGS
ncbi:MAG: NAD+ synthase [Nitrospira sp.]|nr:NAD+ synthase [Nitrospira sp.]MCP9460961.1 NAD+ synthase [Nitrospira sp.]MCP9474531.1 NAD+ synthase [Nitrospira sp.]